MQTAGGADGQPGVKVSFSRPPPTECLRDSSPRADSSAPCCMREGKFSIIAATSREVCLSECGHPGSQFSEAVDRSADFVALASSAWIWQLCIANAGHQSLVIFFSPLLAAVLAEAYSSVRVGMVRRETVCRA
jgi:hypothetical protein